MNRRFASLVAGAALVGCGLDPISTESTGVLLLARGDADPTTERMLVEASSYIEAMTGEAPQVARLGSGRFGDVVRATADRSAGLAIVMDADTLAADEVDAERIDALGQWGFVLQTEDAGEWDNRLDSSGATFMLLAGGTPLARQYATYESLRRLGARFFHPEQEFVPRRSVTDLRELAKRPTAIHRGSDDHVPEFFWRSWSFHSSHPLEHLESFSDAAFPIDEARNVNLWQVKNFGNRFRGAGRGVSDEASRAQRVAELEAMRLELGFPRGTGITLHNQQQGASAEIDRESDVPVQTQIENLVAARLADVPDAQWFGIHFGPTEFTTTPGPETVDWINWAGRKALEVAPDVTVEINNHITGSQPMEGFDDLGCANNTNPGDWIDYYDLSFHTDPRLGVRVHTVMFYPLEGQARVYNQNSFAHKLCLMEKASAEGRPIGWFPEGSWWLSFDNPIPMYLPLHVWTRWRDVDLVKPLLESRGGTLRDHRMFNSGHEWGYWQQDYAVALLGWNADTTHEQIWDEILDPLCEGDEWREPCAVKAEVTSVLTELVDHQRAMFLDAADFRGRPGGLYSYFAGEDQADIVAADAGLEFRPVRVSFAEVLEWSQEELAHFRDTDLARINESALFMAGLRDRMDDARPLVPEHGLPWFEEIADGIEIDEMRARQTSALYTSVLAIREAELAEEANPGSAGEAQYGAAQMVLAQAELVIRRREAAYRYPAAQTHGGGLTEETAVANGTTYPYRVHTKTHLLTYWHNRDAEVRALIDGVDAEASMVQMGEAIDAPGAPLTISWPEDAGDGRISIGETTVDRSVTTLDLGSEPGYWAVEGETEQSNPFIGVRGGIVRSDARSATPAQGLTLVVPNDETAQAVLAGVFPAIEWAWLDAPEALAFGVDPEDDGSVDFQRVVRGLLTSSEGDSFVTEPVAFSIPVSTSGGGTVEVRLTEVVLSGEQVDGVLDNPVGLAGQISVPDLVAALVDLAGFDEQGSLELLAGLLSFDAADPPETVAVEAELAIE